MTGEYATATIHFVGGGIYIECEDMGYGAFATDGKGLMECIQTIDDIMNPNSVFRLTEKGEKEVEQRRKEEAGNDNSGD